MSGVQVPPPLFILMKYIYPNFLKHIKKNNLINNKDTIILAFSGGKDSVTLALLLNRLKDDINITLKAAYFNHKIRKDAAAEQRWAENFCRFNHLELIVGSKDVIGFKNKKKLNLENAASISRYRFFEGVASGFKHCKIATAHTQSDLTETFLIKLFRGSGFRGLTAIYSQKGEKIIRPLLIFTKEDILSFLSRNKIGNYEDYTNVQNEFLRNRIRNTLMPEIKKIEPDIDKHIFKTALMVQDEYDYLNEFCKKFLETHLILKKILPIQSFTNLHIALKRNILREYVRNLKGDLLNIDFEHIENILENIHITEGISIPGLNLTFHKGFVFPQDLSIPEYHYTSQSDGILRIKEIGCEIKIEKKDVFKMPKNNFELLIPYSKVKFPLIIRNPKKGDRYIKMNTTFNQKVFEMIRVAGFPSELRNLCPVVINGDQEIIWGVGSPISDLFKVEDIKSNKFVKIIFQIK